MPNPLTRRSLATLLLAALVCAACAARVQAQEGPAPERVGRQAVGHDAATRERFVRACAACHGEDGSGAGPTVLDRPARDFKSGGFSFGNTPDALLRTITYGIPGTPMPAFAQAYTDTERLALAEYVRALGPPVEELDVSERVVVVTDRARVVRGILPPVTDGAPIRPRGLLIGTPEGLSFEYRIDDVRLLAVRQGEFVERTDWVGRGGTPLKPLGVPVVLFGGGDPGPALEMLEVGAQDTPLGLAASQPLETRLLAIRECGHSVMLSQALTWHGSSVAVVDETVRAVAGPTGVAWERSFELVAQQTNAPWTLVMRLAPAGAPVSPAADAPPGQVLSTLPDGRIACLQVGVAATDMLPDAVDWRVERAGDAARLRVELAPHRGVRLVVRTILLSEWTDATRAALGAWQPPR
jgi:mono/diheme cytochrome c family protein